MRPFRVACVAALLMAALVGCADTSEDPSVPPSPSFSATPVPPTSVEPSSKAGEITVTGTVADGVESGCLLLRTGTVSYLLIASPAQKQALSAATGDVTVRGRPQPDMVTTCQQGTPLEVSEVLG